jgi:hypothetical protein
VNKLGTVEEEADESSYWMELLVEGELMPEAKLSALMQESDEILRIISASRLTAKRNAHADKQIANRKSQIANRKSPHA